MLQLMWQRKTTTSKAVVQKRSDNSASKYRKSPTKHINTENVFNFKINLSWNDFNFSARFDDQFLFVWLWLYIF